MPEQSDDSETNIAYILQNARNQQDTILALLSWSSILPYEIYPRQSFVEYAQQHNDLNDIIEAAADGVIGGNCYDFSLLQQRIYNEYMPSIRSYILETSIILPDSSSYGHAVNLVCTTYNGDTVIYLVDPTTNTSYWSENKLLNFNEMISILAKGDHDDIVSRQATELIPQRACFPFHTSSYISFWPVSSPAYAKRKDTSTLIFSNRDEMMWKSLVYTEQSYILGLKKAGLPSDWIYMYWFKNPQVKLTLDIDDNTHWKQYFTGHFPEIRLH